MSFKPTWPRGHVTRHRLRRNTPRRRNTSVQTWTTSSISPDHLSITVAEVNSWALSSASQAPNKPQRAEPGLRLTQVRSPVWVWLVETHTNFVNSGPSVFSLNWRGDAAFRWNRNKPKVKLSVLRHLNAPRAHSEHASLRPVSSSSAVTSDKHDWSL